MDHDFGAIGEVVRVFLKDKQVYRAELNSPDVTLTVRQRFAGARIPRVYLVSDSRLSSGSSVVEIFTDHDGEYEIWPVWLAGSRTPARLRLYRDVNESGRCLAGTEVYPPSRDHLPDEAIIQAVQLDAAVRTLGLDADVDAAGHARNRMPPVRLRQ